MSNSDIVFGIGGDNSELKRSNDEAQRLIEEWVGRAQSTIESVDGTVPINLDLEKLASEIGAVNESLSAIAPDVDASQVQELTAAIKAYVKDLQAGNITLDEFHKGVETLSEDTNSLAVAIANVVKQAESLGGDINYNVNVEGFQKQLEEAAQTEHFKQAGQEIADALDPNKLVDVEVFQQRLKEAAQADHFREAGEEIAEALRGKKAEQLREETEKIHREIIGVVGRITAVVTAAVSLVKATENITRDWSGYNDELETSKRLIAEIADRANGLRANEIGSFVNAGDADGLTQRFQDAIKELGKLREEHAKTEQQFKDSGFLFSTELDGRVQFTSQVSDNLDAATDALNRQQAAVNQYRKGIEQLNQQEKQRSADNDAAAARREDQLRRELENLRIRQERARGNDAAADAIGAQQRFRDDRGRGFSDADAKALEAERQKTKAAEETARAQEEADRESARRKDELARKEDERQRTRKREQDRFAREQERHQGNIERQRERAASDEARIAERRLSLRNRQANERRNANRAIGGVDSSLQAAISRIQQAASKPDPRTELQERHNQELLELEREARTQRKRQTDALEKIASNPPAGQQGLL